MIEEDFFQAVEDAGLGLPIAWPGTDFKPPASGYWLEPRLFRGEGLDPGIPNSSRALDQGVMQINVGTRPGKGIIGLVQKATLVQAAFPKGKTFASGVRIVNNAYQLSIIEDGDKILLPVTMNYSQ